MIELAVYLLRDSPGNNRLSQGTQKSIFSAIMRTLYDREAVDKMKIWSQTSLQFPPPSLSAGIDEQADSNHKYGLSQLGISPLGQSRKTPQRDKNALEQLESLLIVEASWYDHRLHTKPPA